MELTLAPLALAQYRETLPTGEVYDDAVWTGPVTATSTCRAGDWPAADCVQAGVGVPTEIVYGVDEATVNPPDRFSVAGSDLGPVPLRLNFSSAALNEPAIVKSKGPL